MSVLKTLRDRVAPELNHLYTAPPSEAAGGLDCGWRGREHALHTFFIARMFGAPAELCTGDFAVLSRFVPPLTSMGRDDGHAWCSVSGVVPVDLSLTFREFGAAPQLRSPIVGEGRNGDWHVTYAEDESLLDENVQDRNEILYIEKAVRAESAADLLQHPSLLLAPPRPAEAGGWTTLHGADIHAKITLYCFRCATGELKSQRHRLPRAELVAWIAANIPAPESAILARLKG